MRVSCRFLEVHFRESGVGDEGVPGLAHVPEVHEGFHAEKDRISAMSSTGRTTGDGDALG